jgi:DinB superfamily
VQAQLERVERELADGLRRVHDVAAPLTPELWSARPAPNEWSVAECVTHLNLTSRAYVPLIDAAIRDGSTRNVHGAGPFRHDVVGAILDWITEPPVRVRLKTTTPFVPAGLAPQDQVIADFDMLQAQLVERVKHADGLHLGRVRVTSPFASRLRDSLYRAFG